MTGLVDYEYFEIGKDHQAKNCEVFLSLGKIRTLIILTGSGTILPADGNSGGFMAGDTIVVPAAYKGAIRFAAETQFLTITI